jgi:hypothetical protein
MAGRPRLLRLIKKEATPTSTRAQRTFVDFERRFNGCCWPRFKFAFVFELTFRLVPPYSHFDPFGTEFHVSRGGSTIRLRNYYKDPSNFCRNSMRPRARRDLTVPTLIPKVVAISS